MFYHVLSVYKYYDKRNKNDTVGKLRAVVLCATTGGHELNNALCLSALVL